MTKKILPLLLAAMCLHATAALAQLGLGKPKDIAIVKGQPLIVLLKDEDPDELKKLAKKPDELADYKAYVADYNTEMQALAPQLWHFSPSVEFHHEAELKDLRKAKGQQHGLLRQMELVTVHRHAIGGAAAQVAGAIPNYFYTSDAVSSLVLELVGDGDESQVARVSLAPGPIYHSDYIFAFKSMQDYIQRRASGGSSSDFKEEIAANGKKLKTKILLLEQDDTKDRLTPAQIKQAYPFKYQIVPRATIEQAVAAADARYAYVRMMPATGSIMMQIVVDAADQSLLVYSMPNRVRVMGIGGGQQIGQSNLKDFAQFATGK